MVCYCSFRVLYFLRHLTGHRGCVTPAQIENLRESTNGDLDYVDGYDEVPPEMQDKIKRALDQGHIDDEDWKGVNLCKAIISHACSLQVLGYRA